MGTSSTDRIEKQVMLRAPRARVWRALTDANEFGTWFRVKLDGAFVVGQPVSGHITYPGYEYLKFEALVEPFAVIKPQRLGLMKGIEMRGIDLTQAIRLP